MVFGLSENNIAMITDLVVYERYLKWNHLSCTFLKKLS